MVTYIKIRNIIRAVRKKRLMVPFNDKEFALFFKKFIGILKSKGKNKHSFKTIRLILYRFKKKFKFNPIEVFFIIIKRLMPDWTLVQNKQGRRAYFIPMLAKGNRRNIYVLDWIIRQLKNKSNVIGVNSEDIYKILVETFFFKGTALKLKKQFTKHALDNRGNIRKNLKQKFSYKKFEVSYKTKIIKQIRKQELLLYKPNKNVLFFMELKRQRVKIKKRFINHLLNKEKKKKIRKFFKKVIDNARKRDY